MDYPYTRPHSAEPSRIGETARELALISACFCVFWSRLLFPRKRKRRHLNERYPYIHILALHISANVTFEFSRVPATTDDGWGIGYINLDTHPLASSHILDFTPEPFSERQSTRKVVVVIFSVLFFSFCFLFSFSRFFYNNRICTL